MNKKNLQYIILVALLFATGLVYWFFLRPKPVEQDSSAMMQTTAGSEGAQTTADGSAPAFQKATDLDIETLKDPRLQQLNAPVYPTVDSSEVGKTNPFQ